VAKSFPRRSSNSTVECQASITALSRADPGRSIDWVMPSRAKAWRKDFAVLAALIGMQDDARDLAAADRHRHAQRARRSMIDSAATAVLRSPLLDNSSTRPQLEILAVQTQ
jgi:hypothetical protein